MPAGYRIGDYFCDHCRAKRGAQVIAQSRRPARGG